MGKTQIFFLPYAGGSSFSFMKVIRFLKPELEAITIEYAGRGKRKDEPYIELYEDFIEDVVKSIKEKRNTAVPYAIFGYSMGSALAFDICSKGMLDFDPVHCFFCAEGSVIEPNPAREYASLPEEEFKNKIISLGGIDVRMLGNKAVLDEYLQLIMADHKILGQFKYNKQHVKCPASIIYSEEDETCTHMDDWSRVVDNDIGYHKFGGDHFFINSQFRRVAEIINSRL